MSACILDNRSCEYDAVKSRRANTSRRSERCAVLARPLAATMALHCDCIVFSALADNESVCRPESSGRHESPLFVGVRRT